MYRINVLSVNNYFFLIILYLADKISINDAGNLTTDMQVTATYRYKKMTSAFFSLNITTSVQTTVTTNVTRYKNKQNTAQINKTTVTCI